MKSTIHRWIWLCAVLLVCGNRPALGADGGKAVGRVVQLSSEQRQSADLKASSSAGLFVGVGEFEEKSGLSRLNYTPDDAVALAHLFVVELGLIPPANARLALGGQPKGTNSLARLTELRKAGVTVLPARKVELLDALSDVAHAADDPAGLVIVALSSHGFEQNEDVYLMPADSRRAYIESTGISLRSVKATLRASKANKRILLLDACREKPASETKGDETMSAAFRKALQASEGFAVLLSCETGQLSWEAPEFSQGVFTHFFLQAVRGGTRPAADGLIRLGDVSRQAAESTRDWVRRNKQAEQVPTLNGELARQIPLGLDANMARQLADQAAADRKLDERRTQALSLLAEARKRHRAVLSGALEDEIEQAAHRRTGDDLTRLLEQIEEQLKNPTAARAQAFVGWWTTFGKLPPAGLNEPKPEPTSPAAPPKPKAQGAPLAPEEARRRAQAELLREATLQQQARLAAAMAVWDESETLPDGSEPKRAKHAEFLERSADYLNLLPGDEASRLKIWARRALAAVALAFELEARLAGDELKKLGAEKDQTGLASRARSLLAEKGWPDTGGVAPGANNKLGSRYVRRHPDLRTEKAAVTAASHSKQVALDERSYLRGAPPGAVNSATNLLDALFIPRTIQLGLLSGHQYHNSGDPYADAWADGTATLTVEEEAIRLDLTLQWRMLYFPGRRNPEGRTNLDMAVKAQFVWQRTDVTEMLLGKGLLGVAGLDAGEDASEQGLVGESTVLLLSSSRTVESSGSIKPFTLSTNSAPKGEATFGQGIGFSQGDGALIVDTATGRIVGYYGGGFLAHACSRLAVPLEPVPESGLGAGPEPEDPAMQFIRGARFEMHPAGKRIPEAIRCYEKAANLGHALSTERLVEIFEGRSGSEFADEQKAFHWVIKAAENGSKESQLKLASIYDGRNSGPAKPDPVQAFRWFEAAAKLGDPEAQHETAQRLARGQGVEANFATAVSWFRKAADGGNREAQFTLARILERGRGLAKDKAEAAALYRKAAASGYVDAEKILKARYPSEAKLLYQDRANAKEATPEDMLKLADYLNPDPQRRSYEAETWYKKAAEAGNVTAQLKLASLLEERDYSKSEGASWRQKALAQLNKAAEAGEADSQFALAELYANGTGVPKDDSIAIKWYQQAAGTSYDAEKALTEKYPAAALQWLLSQAEKEPGDANLLSKISGHYATGLGTATNLTAAAEWLKKAADQGELHYQLQLAVLYEQGDGSVRNPDAASALYKKVMEKYRATLNNPDSSEFDLAGAALAIAELYANGRGVERNPAEALSNFRFAAEKGDYRAIEALEKSHPDEALALLVRQAEENGDYYQCLKIADLYERSANLPAQKTWNEKAIAALRRQADAGDTAAQLALAQCYRDGKQVEKNPSLAFSYLQKAAVTPDEEDRPEAYEWLAELYEKGTGTSPNPSEAAKWYAMAAEAYRDQIELDEYGWGRGEAGLARLCLAGKGVPKDTREALRLLRKAAEKGNTEAEFQLGQVYDAGKEVPKDRAQAIQWYRKAADRGHDDAKKALQALGG